MSQVIASVFLGEGTLATLARPVGWGFVWWGTVLYWVAGALYAWQAAGLIRAARQRRAGAVRTP